MLHDDTPDSTDQANVQPEPEAHNPLDDEAAISHPAVDEIEESSEPGSPAAVHTDEDEPQPVESSSASPSAFDSESSSDEDDDMSGPNLPASLRSHEDESELQISSLSAFDPESSSDGHEDTTGHDLPAASSAQKDETKRQTSSVAASDPKSNDDEDATQPRGPGPSGSTHRVTANKTKPTRKSFTSPRTLRATFVPPGRNDAGYVAFGDPSVASQAQGNYAGIDVTLRGQIVDQELDNERNRSEDSRLSYKEIFAKYTQWDVSQTSVRQQNRKYTNPEGASQRDPVFTQAHIDALRQAVPRSKNGKGVISWARVVDEVKQQTGRTFWQPTLRRKWEALERSGTDKSGGEHSDDGGSNKEEKRSSRRRKSDENHDEEDDGGAGPGPATRRSRRGMQS